MPSPFVQKSVAATVVLTGNPNCGKSTVFNALTGLRAKVANYAGVTVERKEGRMQVSPPHVSINILDLPGSYSLSPQSLDERISRDVLCQRLPEMPKPDLVVVVIDASNLDRSLYYATQVIELGHPTMIALNMMDVAAANGHMVSAALLARSLSVPVVPVVATTGKGLSALHRQIFEMLQAPTVPAVQLFCDLPGVFQAEWIHLQGLVAKDHCNRVHLTPSETLLLLSDERTLKEKPSIHSNTVQAAAAAARKRLEAAQIAWNRVVIEARHARASVISRAAVTRPSVAPAAISDRLDRVLTHPTWGLIVFALLMLTLFQSIFTLARFPMNAFNTGLTQLGDIAGRFIPPGEFHSLVTNGVITGVGAVVVFLPQICLLFLFIGLLEDTGYMARAALLMDRVMSKAGLHGKSFIPLLSSFACAIPGILAARTIESPKDRLITILVAPLMSCSARLPVYTLLIAACIPDMRVLGCFRLQGITLMSMYLLGIGMALLVAWLFKKTLFRGEPTMLIMELPPYKRPALRMAFRHMWYHSVLFLKKAGTLVLAINILLWFFVTYPKSKSLDDKFTSLRRETSILAMPMTAGAAAEKVRIEKIAAIDRSEASERLQHSFAGHLGRLIEPVLRPLGMDWQIGIGIVSSFAAREVFVSTMSTVYSVGKRTSAEDTSGLAHHMQSQKRPDGSPLYTPLLGLTLMVFYVFALQCVSTIAVVRKETHSWKWPLFQWLYLGALAWLGAFSVYQGGRLLGWN
jgi:ferrous iron transport protein B